MEGEPVASTGSDPLQAVADAMDAAVNAAKEGVEGARATANEVLPAVNSFLSRAVYRTCYSISYGVVFPSLLIARSIPTNNAVIHGFVDGAHAARDMVDEMKPKSAAGPS
jgi:hypothetical protein